MRTPTGEVPVDLIGMRFGLLTAVQFMHRDSDYKQIWECLCDCGSTVMAHRGSLKRGNTTSCGCGRVKHGETASALYGIWQCMLNRCANPNYRQYADYGGRGVKVCDQWRHDFVAFRDYMGHRPTDKHTLDRIDNNGDYEPGNVRWSTRAEQLRNRRNNVMLTHNGETLCLADWAKRLDCHFTTLLLRLRKMPVAEALTKPIAHCGRRVWRDSKP